MHSSMIMLTAVLMAAAQQHPTVENSAQGRSTEAWISLIDEVDVPAKESGELLDILVREGQQVNEGDLLAQIDDQLPKTAEKVASCRLDVAKLEAENENNVDYANASHDVAEAELAKSLDANRRVPNTVTSAELLRQALAVAQAKLQIKQAEHELKVAKVTVSVREAELEAARQDVNRRKIKAPIDGIIVKRNLHKGEFARPGDAVMRLIRVDRLFVEQNLSLKKFSPFDVEGKRVTVTANLAGRRETFEGKIVFASPEIKDAMGGGHEFAVKAEVINRQDRNGNWLLSTGLRVNMTIHVN